MDLLLENRAFTPHFLSFNAAFVAIQSETSVGTVDMLSGGKQSLCVGGCSVVPRARGGGLDDGPGFSRIYAGMSAYIPELCRHCLMNRKAAYI